MNQNGIGGDGLAQVSFEQVAGRPSTCALTLKDRIYPLSLKGVAWIDRETGIIRRIKAGLISPLKDINIQSFDIDVVYKSQVFSSDKEMKWLPSIATIDVRTELQRWRNIHLFSKYKRFTVLSVESELR